LTLPEPVKADKRSTDSSPEEMCARYTLGKARLADVAEALDAEFAAEDEEVYKPRYNAAPTDLGWVVVYGADRRVVRRARWNYRTSANRILINIRAETIGFGRFRDSFATNRCAVIADGFYEWAGDGGAPTWFHAADDALMLLGGLLKFSEVAGVPPRFSVLTTMSNTVVAPVHDRMPVIIGSGQLDDWLTGDAGAALAMMNPAPSALLKATKVSKRVNSVKNDDPDCTAERGPDNQGSLF
jgi:putative SOS response-associated peptidase YedK